MFVRFIGNLFRSSSISREKNVIGFEKANSDYLFPPRDITVVSSLPDIKLQDKLFQMENLLGISENALWFEIDSHKDVVEPFRKYVTNQIGVLDTDFNLEKLKNNHYDIVGLDEKRKAQIKLFDGFGKYDNYLGVYKNKLLDGAGTLLTQLFYLKLQELVNDKKISLAEINKVDNYLRIVPKQDDLKNIYNVNKNIDDYKWAINLLKNNPSEAGIILELISDGQMLLCKSLEAQLAGRSEKETSEQMEPSLQKTLVLMKESPHKLKRLSELADLKSLSAFDDNYCESPNNLLLHVQQMKLKTKELLKTGGSDIKEDKDLNGSELDVSYILKRLETLVFNICKQLYEDEEKIVQNLKIQSRRKFVKSVVVSTGIVVAGATVVGGATYGICDYVNLRQKEEENQKLIERSRQLEKK